VVLHKAAADFSQQQFAVAGAIDGNPQTGWAIAPAFGKPHVAVFETKEPAGFPNGTILTFVLDQQFSGKEHNIGKFRLAVTTAPPPITIDNLPDPIAKILAVPAEKRTEAHKADLVRYFRALDPEWVRRSQALAAYPVPGDKRLVGAQDLTWALLNSP